MSAFRTSDGGRVNRAAPLSFTFDGQTYRGYAGDTLASALIANGVHLVGRSFKYHRPRGVLSAGSEEPNALVELRRGARREPAGWHRWHRGSGRRLWEPARGRPGQRGDLCRPAGRAG